MRRMIEALAAAALIAIILVASISPALGRSAHFGQRMPIDKPCTLADTAQNEPGAHHIFDPPGHTGCWLVLPGQNE